LPFDDPIDPFSDILEHIREIESFLTGMARPICRTTGALFSLANTRCW